VEANDTNMRAPSEMGTTLFVVEQTGKDQPEKNAIHLRSSSTREARLACSFLCDVPIGLSAYTRLTINMAACLNLLSPESDSSGRQKRLWTPVVMLLLAMGAVLGLVLYMKSTRTNRGGVRQEPKVKVVVQPPAREQEPSNSSNPSEKPQTVTGKAEREPAEPPAPAKPHRAAHEAKTAVAEYEGFTTKQVPQLVRKAEEDAGAGNCDRAKQEYEIVLKLQPGNTSAKDGLRKLSLKMSERR
jgi:hypothetical protein